MSFKYYKKPMKSEMRIEDLPEPPEIKEELIISDNSSTDVANHANDIEYELRFPRLYEMILYDKLSFKEFRNKAVKEFKISQSNANALWYAARNRIKERFSDRSDQIVEEQLARMFDLLKRCRKDGNKKVERELLSDLNKIYGLEHRRIDITSGGEPISINISVE